MYLGTRQLIAVGVTLVIVGSIVVGDRHVEHYHQDPVMYPTGIHLTTSGVSSSSTYL